jgi:hypothetical protein
MGVWFLSISIIIGGCLSMEFKDVIKEFAIRTKENLIIIEKLANNNDLGVNAYEVTQLINSMLGLLVFPKEKYIKAIPEILLSDLVKAGWAIPEVKGSFPQAKNLRELIRYMRNTIAHFNLDFIYSENSISGLALWNCRRDLKTWQVEMGLEQLKDIAFRFIDLLVKQEVED